IIDGGNSYFKDDARRARMLRAKEINYVDVGTSGGVWGLERGYCMMIGGPEETVRHLDPIFKTLAPGRGNIVRTPGREKVPGTVEDGYLYCGPSGAGHFVKMVHNGIEYGLMQAYTEGFDIFHNANSKDLPEEHRYDLNVADIAEVWRRGSVVSSWLLDLTAMALVEVPELSNYSGYVQDSGEGRWTIMAAIEEAVPAEGLSVPLCIPVSLPSSVELFQGHLIPVINNITKSNLLSDSNCVIGVARDQMTDNEIIKRLGDEVNELTTDDIHSEQWKCLTERLYNLT